ncbi:MAG: nucleoside triphosphate pyrophosphohydrolase [Spirochaetota bacterium]
MENFDKLVKIVEKLRSPEGCEWDKSLDLKAVKSYFLEEAYEVYEAIINEDHDELQEELGDLLFEIVLIAELEAEQGLFNLEDTIDIINNKMIRRHPHVFTEDKTKDVNKILNNWEKIKNEEKKHRKSYLDGIPKILPTLIKANKIQEKASRVGFDWSNIEDVIKKVKEELSELEEELKKLNAENYQNSKINDEMLKYDIESEIGDLLFSVVNLARKLNIDSDEALTKTIDTFYERFNYIEKKLQKANKSIHNSSLEEMDKLWDESKSDAI